MSDIVNCANCHTRVILMSEGICPACRKPGTATVIETVSHELSSRDSEVCTTVPGAETGNAEIVCAFCGKVDRSVQPGFVVVHRQQWQNLWLTAKQMHGRCQCCDSCIAGISHVVGRRFLAGCGFGLSFGIALVWMVLFGTLIEHTSFNSKLMVAINLIGAIAIIAAGTVAGPCLLHRWLKRTIPRLLGPRADDTLRQKTGIPRWGFATTVTLNRKAPCTKGPLFDL